MTGGAKNLKPDGYRLIWRAREEACKRGPASYLPFSITGQRVPINGEVKRTYAEPKGNQPLAA